MEWKVSEFDLFRIHASSVFMFFCQLDMSLPAVPTCQGPSTALCGRALVIDLDGLAMGGEPYPDSTLNVEEVDTQIEVGALSVRRWNRWGHLRSSCKGDIVSGKVFFSTIHLPHE